MKTAISISDKTFQKADKAAKKLGISRSRLFAIAVESFIEPFRSGEITKTLDEIYSDELSSLDSILGVLQAGSISQEKW